MPSASDFRAAGRILSIQDDALVFQPLDTTYQLRLVSDAASTQQLGQHVECLIHLAARKLYTVPSGGRFITPIFGPPRIVQGQIRYLDQTAMVLQAGAPILVDLPTDDSAYDLTEGPLAVGTMINLVALPGARIENIRHPDFAPATT